MFKFTFNIGGSGLNPFAAQAEQRDQFQQANTSQTITRKLPPPPRRTIPSSSPQDNEPISRKRGWTPGLSSPSAAISQPALTNGWLDTPSRYLDAASRSPQNVAEAGLEEDLPPAKRRKTLTDSIIGTALSAALIGTAVGMTAYRMWRDRGKTDPSSGESMEQPPPPYEKEEWQDEGPKNKPSSPTPRLPRKSRTITRRTPRRRMAPIVISPARSPTPTQSPSILAACQSEPAETELDEQIDWMGDKIRELIVEGQKALGKEVVILGDEPNGDDAVDDGLEGWEEVEEHNHCTSSSSLKLPNIRRGPSWPSPSHNSPITPSVSPPARSGLSFSGSFVNGSLSPRSKRSRSFIATPKQGTSPDGNCSMKVLYEPTTAIPNLDIDNVPDDDDSRALTERMERIRRAYKIQ